MPTKSHRHAARRLLKRDDPLPVELDIPVQVDMPVEPDMPVLEKRFDIATIFSVVYVTAPATFAGPTAGFVTLGATTTAKKTLPINNDDDDNDSTTSKSKAAATTSKSSSPARVTSTISTTAKLSSSSSSSTTSSLAAVTSSAAASSTIASSTIASSATNARPTSSSSAAADASSGGMGIGAKIGIVGAVICLLAVAVGLVFFLIRKKKEKQDTSFGMQRLDDEKSGFGSIQQSPRTTTVPQPPSHTRAATTNNNNNPAPRISYRPGSQFSAGILGDAEKAAAGVTMTHNDPANPFGIHAQTVEPHSRDMVSPIPEERSISSPHELQGSPVPSPTTASFNMNSPSTPNAELGMASAVPVSAAVAGAAIVDPPGSTVRRVQLEFKPSMDDELELKVGQIVRVLHEYDDGWALCMRMDRSQQGVAPRTCLSKVPLKPRPMGPPPPGARNGPPHGPPRGPPRPGQSPYGTPRPGPGPNVRQPQPAPAPASAPTPAPAPQDAAANQARRPSLPPSKQSSPTLTEQTQQRQRSMSVSSTPTKTARKPVPNPVSPVASHRRSVSMNSTVSGLRVVNGDEPSPLGVPARKPVPGQAL